MEPTQNQLDSLFRAVESPLENYTLGQNPLVTSLVLGTPQTRQMPSRQILTPLGVDSVAFKWFSYGVERLKSYDTKRGLRAKIRHSDWAATTHTDELVRYSWSIVKDDAEIANGHPSLRVREVSAMMARDIVQLGIEQIAATLLTTTTSYPASHRLAISAGSEWDAAGGDSYADVTAMANQICDDIGCLPGEINAFVPSVSLRAALQDPVFRASRAYQTTDQASLDTLARYWGIGSAFTGNVRVASDAGVVSNLYSDCVILFYPGSAAAYDTSYGELQFGATFSWNRGMALEAWRDPSNTSWYFPWEEWVKHKIINNYCGAIITNCAA